MDCRTKPLSRAERQAADEARQALSASAAASAALPSEASVRKKIPSKEIPEATAPVDSDVSPYKPGLRSRGWVFTWNNPILPTGFANFVDFYKAWEPQISYLVVGDEKAPTTGTPHHQGAVWFKSQRTWPACRSSIKCWWAPAKGSGEQNFNYSKKDCILIEYGERKQPGSRSDLEDVRELIREGASMREVTERASNLQAIKVGQLFLQHHPELQQRRNWNMQIFWIKGPAGIGKTRWCSEQAPNAHYSSRNLQWWDGYADQEDVIVDDFRGDFCTYHELLRIQDRYPYRVQIKGSSCELLAKRIFFTSCLLPTECYATREDIWQLLRRITAVYEFNEDGSANIWRYVDKVDTTKVEQLGKLPPRTVELSAREEIILPGLGTALPPRDFELIIKNPADSTQRSGGNKCQVGNNSIIPSLASPDICKYESEQKCPLKHNPKNSNHFDSCECFYCDWKKCPVCNASNDDCQHNNSVDDGCNEGFEMCLDCGAYCEVQYEIDG